MEFGQLEFYCNVNLKRVVLNISMHWTNMLFLGRPRTLDIHNNFFIRLISEYNILEINISGPKYGYTDINFSMNIDI